MFSVMYNYRWFVNYFISLVNSSIVVMVVRVFN